MSEMPLLNREAEERLLAELASSSMLDVEETKRDLHKLSLTGEAFGHQETRETFALMQDFLHRGEPCGMLQLEGEAKRLGVVLGWLIIRQGQSMGSLTHARSWATELKDLASRRKLRALALELQHRSRNPVTPPEETITYLAAQMNGLVTAGPGRIETLDSKLEVVSRQLDEVGRSGGEMAVIKTGIDLWDRNVGGLWPTLNVIGGHTSRGKSALAASMIMGLAKQGIPGIIFSMEDPAEWLLYRYLAFESRVSGFLMRTRELNANQQEAVGGVWEGVREWSKHIMFDERSRLKPAQLVAAAREAILTRGARWVFADHAGEFSYEKHRDGQRPDMDIAEGLSDMRAIAKTHGVPFVLLSQLSRSAKIPHTLADFKNASAIEECARIAAIVWTKDGAPLEPTVSILKVTGGRREFDLKFQLDATSGLLIEPPSVTSIPPAEQGALL